MHRRRFATLLLAAALAPALAACANYSAGSGAKLPFSTITIAPILNDTHIPQVQALLHAQLADAFAAENNVRLVAKNAHTTLRIRLVNYERTVASTNPDDTALGLSFNLRLTAEVTLDDNRTGKPLFSKRKITVTNVAHMPVEGTSGFGAVETQTLPVLTRELANHTRNSVTGVW